MHYILEAGAGTSACDLPTVRDGQGDAQEKSRSKGIKESKKIMVRKSRLGGREVRRVRWAMRTGKALKD